MTSAEEDKDLTKPDVERVSDSPLLIGLAYLGQFCLTVLVPVLLIMISVRIVMFPWFLRFEYQRPGFPSDIYGFTTEDRLQYAVQVLDYLFSDESIAFLADMTFQDGSRLFNDAELLHMVDVQRVTKVIFSVMNIASLVFSALLLSLFAKPKLREFARRGIRNGSLLTLGIIISTVVVIFVAWDAFFTAFHSIFFENGTWRFAFSDTLIRLFPEQFWLDASLIIGGMILLGGIILLSIARYWRRDP